MTMREWLNLLGLLVLLLGALPLIRWLARKAGATPEVARKAVHVVMGVSCMSFPWLFERPLPVWVLALSASGLLGILRWLPALRGGMGSAVHGVSRLSYGELLFAPAVAAVFHGAHGDLWRYLIPLAVLTISDAAGAVVGTQWGRMRYGCGNSFKTVEGSAIFLLTGWLCVFAPLVASGTSGLVDALLIALILATLTMMAEGISDRGFDNLVIPLGCFLLLNRLLVLDTPALTGRLIAVSLLLALVLCSARWSTLSGSALLASALLAYACAIIADWRFALPPAAIFFCHLATTQRHHLCNVLDHRLDVVLAHAVGCLPWVILAGNGTIPVMTGLAGISFAMAAQLAMLDAMTRYWLGHHSPEPLRAMLKGWIVAGIPGLMWFGSGIGRLLVPLAVALAVTVLALRVMYWIRPRHETHPRRLRLIKGLLALAASLPALLLDL